MANFPWYNSIGFFAVGSFLLFVPNFSQTNNVCYYPMTVHNHWCWTYFWGYHHCDYQRLVPLCCSGWTMQSNCTERCPNGNYGYDCGKNCHCGGEKCNPVDGYCGDEICEDLCVNNRYCDYISQTCLCMPGWRGWECNLPCYEGFYGRNCSNTCDCINGMCSNIDGECICDPGWTGMSCNRSCDTGFYGNQCEETCNCNSSSVSCDPVNGICYCPLGFYGDRCQKTCPNGFFGNNCSETCSCVDDQACDAATGICDDNLSSTTEKQSSTRSVALGSTIAALILVVVVLTSVMLWKKMIQKQNKSVNVNGLSTHGSSPNESNGNTTMHYSVEPNIVNAAEISSPRDRNTYENTNVSVAFSIHDDNGTYGMLNEELDSRRTDESKPHGREDDSIKIPLKRPADDTSDYEIPTPFPGYYKQGNYEEPYTFPEIESLDNDKITLNAGYAVPVPRYTGNCETSYVDVAKVKNGKITPTSCEDNTDMSDTISNSNDYSKISRNNVRNTQEMDNEEYGKLIKTEEFNESDEEYDTPGVLRRRKHLNQTRGNTYSVDNEDYGTLIKTEEFNESDEEYDTLGVIRRTNLNQTRDNAYSVDNEDYGKLIKTEEFNESDEEYDTLGVIRRTHPNQTRENTYSVLN